MIERKSCDTPVDDDAQTKRCDGEELSGRLHRTNAMHTTTNPTISISTILSFFLLSLCYVRCNGSIPDVSG